MRTSGDILALLAFEIGQLAFEEIEALERHEPFFEELVRLGNIFLYNGKLIVRRLHLHLEATRLVTELVLARSQLLFHADQRVATAIKKVLFAVDEGLGRLRTRQRRQVFRYSERRCFGNLCTETGPTRVELRKRILDDGEVRLNDGGAQPQQDLAGLYPVTFGDIDLADDAAGKMLDFF
ncbi:hypothetical protein D3C86_1532630 [compost metagenome]